MIDSKMDSSAASKTSARWRWRLMSRERRTEREYARSLRKDFRKHLRNIKRASRKGEHECAVWYPLWPTVKKLEAFGYKMTNTGDYSVSPFYSASWPKKQ